MDNPNSAARDAVNGRGIFRATKTYDHNEGLSCCFRQWRAAHSHCRFVHGYALAFKFVMACDELDKHNWCFDFGGMKPIRQWLKEMFDHTMLVAEDDPELPKLQALATSGLADIRVMKAVGCEAVAKFVHDYVSEFLHEKSAGRVWLESVEVREHGGNSAIYSLC